MSKISILALYLTGIANIYSFYFQFRQSRMNPVQKHRWEKLLRSEDQEWWDKVASRAPTKNLVMCNCKLSRPLQYIEIV